MLLLLAWLTQRCHRDEARRIEAQYGTLVTVANLVRRPEGAPFLSVQRFDELAEIARAQGLPVIRDAMDLDQYFVLTRDGTFHYRLTDAPTPLADRPRPHRAA